MSHLEGGRLVFPQGKINQGDEEFQMRCANPEKFRTTLGFTVLRFKDEM